MGSGAWQIGEYGVSIFVPDENRVDAVTPSLPAANSMSTSYNADCTNQQAHRAHRPPLSSIALNPTSRSTLSSPQTCCRNSQVVRCSIPGSPSPLEGSWIKQLQQFCDDGEPATPDVVSDLDIFSDESGYASDKTDSLTADPATPCPRRTKDKPRTNSTALRPDQVQRNRWKTLKTPRKLFQTTSEGQYSLKALKNIERSPSHRWTYSQRLILCTLNRFFHTANAADFALLFNKVTGLDLSARTIHKQAHELKYYGQQAFPVYRRAFNCPLDDPHGVYLPIRRVIERIAHQLGMWLARRVVEEVDNSGRAEFSKSPRTQQQFKRLVRKARYDTRLTEPVAPITHASAIGGLAVPNIELEELHVDLDDGSADRRMPSHIVHPQYYQQHSLAFRVWDQNSRTMFDPDRGFISDLHRIWNGPFLPPPQLDTVDGRHCHYLLANTHLSKTGNASAYVSVATSLIQALSYANNMVDPQLAVINLLAPSLQAPYKQLRASDCLKELKSKGQAMWARYKGLAEVMVFGNIESDAIIHYGSLTGIAAKVTAKPAGKVLLNSGDFQPDRTVSQLTNKLRDRKITLTYDIVSSIAALAKGFNLHASIVKVEHISEFITVIIDGWSIRVNDDIYSRASIATAFALSLGHENLPLHEVIQAFITGLEHGLANVAYYSSRRRTKYRRRRTT